LERGPKPGTPETAATSVSGLTEKPEGIVMFPLSALSGELPWLPSVIA
jgi:hypothetical protein